MFTSFITIERANPISLAKVVLAKKLFYYILTNISVYTSITIKIARYNANKNHYFYLIA